MTHAVVLDRTGGPEVFEWRSLSVGDPGRGEVRVRHTAVGLNYIDVYHRRGVYAIPEFPAILGLEAAGRVEALGPGVRGLSVGDRVAYAGGAMGAYSEARLMPADRLVVLPDGIDDRHAAAAMLKGMTAEYLLRRVVRVRQGQTILVHAAAGGVGLILCQWAASLGVTVIGTVGSAEKAEVAAAHGCTVPLVVPGEDFVARVRELTGGDGVPVVYDSVGQATFMASLDCLSPRGMMVSFGQASGMVPPIDVTVLSAKGSLYLTRPTLFTYIATRDELVESAGALFDAIMSGAVRITIGQEYALRDVGTAHRDLEGRRTVGSTILIP